MKAETFQSKAQGDFYLYYRKSGSDQVTYLVGTRDLHESTYIQDNLPKDYSKALNKDGTHKITHTEDGGLTVNGKGFVSVWSWNSNKLRSLPLSRITKIVPLSTVLRN